MRGVLLAGGLGTRLRPLTAATSKHLLPVYDKPMIYFPLTTLMLAGLREILVITTPQDAPAYRRLLGDGTQWGLSLRYAEQREPAGVAQALIIAETFLDGAPSCLALGDNILFGHGLPERLAAARAAGAEGATVFAHYVDAPERYGVVRFDAHGAVIGIEEKPPLPPSHWAAIGLYFFDGEAPAIARGLAPSARGELEITDVLNAYLARGRLRLEKLGRGFAWFDAGAADALLDAAEYVRVLERRQGQKIACPEEIAFRLGYIDPEALAAAAAHYGDSAYGRYLAALPHRLLD
ncbi:MAG: glucose-1-phosphate thymidylyltransferase RfbA [Hyphomonadaceae bacterium]|nr:glucose-1-phosphate thymidylyltransferase RfbA [Hyphomonadaceae bacterium]